MHGQLAEVFDDAQLRRVQVHQGHRQYQSLLLDKLNQIELLDDNCIGLGAHFAFNYPLL